MAFLEELSKKASMLKNIVAAIIFLVGSAMTIDAYYVNAEDYSIHQSQQALKWTAVDIRQLTAERVIVAESLNKAEHEGRIPDSYLTQRLIEIDEELKFQKSRRTDLRKHLQETDK